MSHYHRIVSLSPSNTEILFALGLDEEVVGVTSFCDYPSQARTRARVKGFSTPDPERILALRPDLVLATYVAPIAVVETLRGRGVEVVPVPDPTTVEGVIENLTAVGQWVGRPFEANQITAALRADLERIVSRVGTIPLRRRPRVLLALGGIGDPFMTAGPGSFLDDLIRLSGGMNAAEGIGMAWAERPLGDLAAFGPEAIVSDYRGRSDPERLRRKAMDLLTQDDRMRGVPAVRSGRIYYLPAELLKRPGPRLVVGLERLARCIHPDAFENKTR